MSVANDHRSLAVVILTYNEEANLPACLESLRGLDCQVFVVDSGSTDRTLDIAREGGADVLHHPFETHTRQWAWALSNLPERCEWILGLDADQRLTPELAEEIRALLTEKAEHLAEVDGFWIKRRQFFRGRWIRHGGYYPIYLLKLFRRDRVFLDEQDRVDHHFYVSGPTRRLRHDLVEENRKENDIIFWINKHVRYAVLLAEEEWWRRQNQPAQRSGPLFCSNAIRRKFWVRKLWNRLPLYTRAGAYFFYRYFLRLGFLDAKEGFVFHFLQAFWFRLLVDIRLEELMRERVMGRDAEFDGDGRGSWG